MTNYNKRLDEIFAPLIDSPSLTLTTTYWGGAKQAITSLIKELVAEAMLEPSTNLTSYEAQMFITSTEEYRQNLLKALEDK